MGVRCAGVRRGVCVGMWGWGDVAGFMVSWEGV